MANKLKKKKSQQPDPDKLKPEKEETLQVKQLVKDERIKKIAGALCLVLAFFLFIAFLSYLFTWQEDQDKVFKGGASFLFADDVKVANLLGRVGAWTSHIFIYNGFGLASFLICSLFFVIGVNLLFSKKIYSLKRNLRYVLAGIIFFSVTLSFISPSHSFAWGGAAGDLINNWLQRFLGWIGTAVTLSVAGLAYFIWRFNPVFNVPQRKPKLVASSLIGQATLTIDTDEKIGEDPGNFLKQGNGKMMTPPSVESNPVNEFKFVEKEELVGEPVGTLVSPKFDQPIVPTIPIAPSKAALQKSVDLELEINPSHEEEEEEILEAEEEELPIKKVEDLQPYEPTLDLRDYKYPSLELLENFGSEKIVQDPAELEANKNQIISTLANYDIAIQKISATVGPTVTLY